jgi:lysophospholipase L1-like esterase
MLARHRTVLFALVTWLLLFGGTECVLALMGLGKPFERSPQFWSGAMDVMQPDPDCGLRMKPFAMMDGMPLNSLGFRDDERIVTEQAKLNVLCLGDSTTFGWSVRPEEAYPARLERLLQGTLDGVEVFNAGVPSYTVYQGLQLYLHHLRGLRRWDVVVVTFGWNETPGEELDLEYAMRRPPVSAPWLRATLGAAHRLRLFNVLQDAYVRHRFDPREDPLVLAHRQYEIYLEQLVAAAKAEGSRVIVLPVLVRPADEGDPMSVRMRSLNDTARAIAHRQGVQWLAIDEPFSANAESIGWFDRFHYNGRGHEIIARSLRSTFP